MEPDGPNVGQVESIEFRNDELVFTTRLQLDPTVSDLLRKGAQFEHFVVNFLLRPTKKKHAIPWDIDANRPLKTEELPKEVPLRFGLGGPNIGTVEVSLDDDGNVVYKGKIERSEYLDKIFPIVPDQFSLGHQAPRTARVWDINENERPQTIGRKEEWPI